MAARCQRGGQPLSRKAAKMAIGRAAFPCDQAQLSVVSVTRYQLHVGEHMLRPSLRHWIAEVSQICVLSIGVDVCRVAHFPASVCSILCPQVAITFSIFMDVNSFSPASKVPITTRLALLGLLGCQLLIFFADSLLALGGGTCRSRRPPLGLLDRTWGYKLPHTLAVLLGQLELLVFCRHLQHGLGCLALRLKGIVVGERVREDERLQDLDGLTARERLRERLHACTQLSLHVKQIKAGLVLCLGSQPP